MSDADTNTDQMFTAYYMLAYEGVPHDWNHLDGEDATVAEVGTLHEFAAEFGIELEAIR